MTGQLVFLFVLWLVAGVLFARAWREPGEGAHQRGRAREQQVDPYEKLGQKQP